MNVPEHEAGNTPRPRKQNMPPVATRWKPGQSGNPGGRPKGRSITARLRAVLEQDHNGKQLMDLLAERVAKEALKGNFNFVKEVLERLDGKAGSDNGGEPHRVIRVVLEAEKGEGTGQ